MTHSSVEFAEERKHSRVLFDRLFQVEVGVVVAQLLRKGGEVSAERSHLFFTLLQLHVTPQGLLELHIEVEELLVQFVQTVQQLELLRNRAVTSFDIELMAHLQLTNKASSVQVRKSSVLLGIVRKYLLD